VSTDGLIVVDKPAGMVVHPAPGNWSGTLVNALLHHFNKLSNVGGDLRPGIEVQRIWPWAHAVDLDERGALASEVRTAVAELLAALDEPSLPACADKP